MIRLTINDKQVELPEPVTAQQVLDAHGGNSRFIALVRNGQIVAKARHTTEEMRDGDVIGIYRVIAGG